MLGDKIGIFPISYVEVSCYFMKSGIVIYRVATVWRTIDWFNQTRLRNYTFINPSVSVSNLHSGGLLWSFFHGLSKGKLLGAKCDSKWAHPVITLLLTETAFSVSPLIFFSIQVPVRVTKRTLSYPYLPQMDIFSVMTRHCAAHHPCRLDRDLQWHVITECDRFKVYFSTLWVPTISVCCFSFTHSQFNTAARQLIELDKPSDSNGDSGEGASSGPLSNGAQRVGEKKNSKKRHSFTSLTMSHKPMLAPPPQRHSMEISGPVLISSSNPTAAARIGEISGGLSCSAPSQV